MDLLAEMGADVSLPEGGFYLWARAPEGDAWGFARRLAETTGVIVSPGEFYGDSSADRVRLAAVQPVDAMRQALGRSRR
ncbi:MAG: hypothetical protein GY773_23410 [Actinomycetia bacterium]|nr:hypothetical protein [Actinomycetes bacterium]